MPDGSRSVKRSTRPLAKPGRSYVVSCSSAFRDSIEALAARRETNAGELVRSVLLLVPESIIADWPDPGEPADDDREPVTLKSGAGAGRPWKRKPRLQMRLPAGHSQGRLRRALAIALAMDRGERVIRLDDGKSPKLDKQLADARQDVERLKKIVGSLAFEAPAEGIRSANDALFVLGFRPGARPPPEAIRTRYRSLASIFHPDALCGDHDRMTVLNEAMAWLKAGFSFDRRR